MQSTDDNQEKSELVSALVRSVAVFLESTASFGQLRNAKGAVLSAPELRAAFASGVLDVRVSVTLALRDGVHHARAEVHALGNGAPLCLLSCEGEMGEPLKAH